jgi:AAA15 family ATPase/GTPase
MKEKLIIRNFGPIKNVELDLGRFNILIGEQATGKSTVAKVLAVCRYFSFIKKIQTVISPFEGGLNIWGLTEALNENSYIYYECEHYSVKVEYTTTKMLNPLSKNNEWITNKIFNPEVTAKSQDFKNLLIELDEQHDLFKLIPSSFFLIDVKNVLDNPLYLPTERGLQSLFSLGQASIPNFANFLYSYFSKVDGILRSFKTETEIEPLNILYINKNGIGYIKKKKDKDFFLLSNAASGYQSTIPIILVMKYYEINNRKKTFIIEEPELNLFPTAQARLMQYLVDKTMNYENKILLTTHSPYIQTSLNNLMYAYQIGQTHPESVSKIIDKKYWLNPDDVSAYRLLKDGTYKNIIDDELKQIDAGEVDDISRDINEEYDLLSDIKYGR